MMGMSAAAKNMFGVIPGTMKPEYHFRFPSHEDFARMIVDIDEYFAPKMKLCIADAILGMEGNGPTAGTPREIGCLIASPNPHKLDMVCAKVIGLSASEVPTLQAARERGLIPDSLDKLAVYGDVDAMVIPDYKNIAVKRSLLFDNKSKLFGKVARSVLEARPTVKPKECKGCEKCKQICPAQAITMKDGKPVIDRKKCIKCFCCQEFCPFGAMKVHRSLIAKILT
jgi:ferredoxin